MRKIEATPLQSLHSSHELLGTCTTGRDLVHQFDHYARCRAEPIQLALDFEIERALIINFLRAS
jgi:hypothetical protein